MYVKVETERFTFIKLNQAKIRSEKYIHFRDAINADRNTQNVLFSPLLSKTFKTHINVEFCHSVKSIKYICKYVNKGSDISVFGVSAETSNDVITQFPLC